jgi:hypothetical protein
LAIALTALRQGADNFGSLRTRHSSASLPPGCTPAQLAMKSDRQAARTASRCAWVGCCAAVGVSVNAMRAQVASEDLSIGLSVAGSKECPPFFWASSRRQLFLCFLRWPLFAGDARFC